MAESERTFEAKLTRFAMAQIRRCNNPDDDGECIDEQTLARAELVAHVSALETERDNLRKALRSAKAAIQSVPEAALGYHETIGYPFRDELLAEIAAVLGTEPKDASA